MSHATLVPSTAPTRVDDLTFSIHTTPFDEDYTPAASTRATTNFANLARGTDRRENLRAALAMIDGRLNDLAPCDNPERDRYTARIEIVSIDVHFTADDGADVDFPLMEMLKLFTEKDAEAVILGTRVPNDAASNFGCIVSDSHTRRVLHYVEKPESHISNLINCGVYLFATDAIFPSIRSAIKRRTDRPAPA